jgi:hypothetical protein
LKRRKRQLKPKLDVRREKLNMKNLHKLQPFNKNVTLNWKKKHVYEENRIVKNPKEIDQRLHLHLQITHGELHVEKRNNNNLRIQHQVLGAQIQSRKARPVKNKLNNGVEMTDLPVTIIVKEEMIIAEGEMIIVKDVMIIAVKDVMIIAEKDVMIIAEKDVMIIAEKDVMIIAEKDVMITAAKEGMIIVVEEIVKIPEVGGETVVTSNLKIQDLGVHNNLHLPLAIPIKIIATGALLVETETEIAKKVEVGSDEMMIDVIVSHNKISLKMMVVHGAVEIQIESILTKNYLLNI